MATSTMKTLLYVSLTLIWVICLTAEAKPAQAVNKSPLAQTQTDVDGDNDFPDVDAEEPVDNDAEEIENESESDFDPQPDVNGEINTDVDTVDGAEFAVADAGAPNPIGRNGWMGYGIGKAQGQQNSGYLTGQSKISHVGIGFGVITLVIAVVVVSGLAIKRPGSNNAPADLNLA